MATALRAWLGIKTLGSTLAMPDIKVSICDGGCFLVMPNVGAEVRADDVEVKNSKLESQVSIVKRKAHIFRVNEVEEKLTQEQRIELLQHQYYQYLLHVGDFGTWNVLLSLDHKRMVAIDMEETRSQNFSNKMDNLFSRSNKLQREWYTPLLKSIVPLTSNMHGDVAQKLVDAGFEVDAIVARAQAFSSM